MHPHDGDQMARLLSRLASYDCQTRPVLAGKVDMNAILSARSVRDLQPDLLHGIRLAAIIRLWTPVYPAMSWIMVVLLSPASIVPCFKIVIVILGRKCPRIQRQITAIMSQKMDCQSDQQLRIGSYGFFLCGTMYV